MTDRYNRADAQSAMERLAAALDKPWARNGQVFVGKPWDDESRTVTGHLWTRPEGAYVGAWVLDYAAPYGGYVIHEMANEGGGVSTPFGSRRRSARDFCMVVEFALTALFWIEGNNL